MLGRAGKKTLIIYKEFSSLQKAKEIVNYYGFEKGISGNELYQIGIKQAENLGIELKKQELTKILINDDGSYLVQTDEQNFRTKSVILAIGNNKKMPKIEGIDRFEGKGISYCAICDGFFYKNKDVCVIGNGSYAISEVNDLLNLTNKITILTNGGNKPKFSSEKVDIIDKKIKCISGSTNVEMIEFEDNTKIKTDGVFIAQGVAGVNDIAKKIGVVTENNSIKINEKGETNIKGIFACGDCTGGLLQISKAVYEGTAAGLTAVKYINERNEKNGNIKN